MRKIFPEMLESLNRGLVFCIFAYWIFCFVLLPFAIPVIAYGSWDNLELVSWIEIIYYVINGVVLIGILKHYLADAFLNVQINTKGVMKTVAITCVLMVAWVGLLALAFGRLQAPEVVLDFFPVSEMGVAMTPGLLTRTRPVLGTICLTCLVPFTVTGLFYATAFAPVCCNRGKLGYLVVAAVLLIPAIFDIVWRGDAGFVLLDYFLRLPVHLLACWSYQKTDTVWAPIFSLSAFNLLMSVANLVF